MSYINSALKKVQKERDSRYVPYDDIISASPDRGSRKVSKRVFFVLAGAIILSATLAASAYFIPRMTAKPVKNTVAAAPAGAAKVTEKAAPQSAAPGAIVPAALATAADQERIAKAAKLYQEALTAHREKREEYAENFYRAALSLDPQNVSALNNLGVLYMGKKRHEEAMELFIKALAAKEDYVDPYYNLASLYSQLGNVDASLWYLERAVQIDNRVREWAKHDTDFEKYRSMTAFKKITEELVKR